MNTRDGLANVFREMSTIGERLGPRLISRTPEEHLKLKTLSDTHRELFNTAIGEIEMVNARTSRAPSAYHALLLLSSLEELAISKTVNSRPIFRGQPNLYDPIPSYFRSDTDRQVSEQSANMFAALIDRLRNANGNSGPARQSYVAIAQHYGIRTRLLDFTPDPAVAVYFAAKDALPVGHTEAVVYYLPLNNVWDAGGRFYLVPAFAERVYLQRGIFVEVPETEVRSFRQRCREVRIPHDPDFQIVRHGHKINILRADKWLKRAIEWSTKQARASGGQPPSTTSPLWFSALQELGYPSFASRATEMMEIARWVDNISDLLYWLVLTIIDNQEVFDPNTMALIARDNLDTIKDFLILFETEIVWMQHEGQHERAEGRKKLCEEIRKCVESAETR
jgi:hypothetical protein